MSNKKKPVKYKGKVYPSLPELCRVVESPVSFFCDGDEKAYALIREVK